MFFSFLRHNCAARLRDGEHAYYWVSMTRRIRSQLYIDTIHKDTLLLGIIVILLRLRSARGLAAAEYDDESETIHITYNNIIMYVHVILLYNDDARRSYLPTSMWVGLE